MTNEVQLQSLSKDGDPALSLTRASSGLVARGRRDATLLVIPETESSWERMLRLAAEGNAEAQFDVGWAYSLGQGVPQDSTEGERWIRKAAEQGYAPAQSNLGLMYLNGDGVPQDCNEAVRWTRKAIEQGSISAQYNFGFMRREGLGVPQDAAEAVCWFRKAADQDCPSAQGVLSELLEGELKYDPRRTTLLWDEIGPLVKIGANKMLNGSINRERWSAAMTAEFGSNLTPFLDMLYTEALEVFGRILAEVYAKVNGTPDQTL